MVSIYVVRHGQTAWNKEEIFRGRKDIPLDETGLKQASLAAEYFRGISCHRIYSSPLQRAWQTALKIAEVIGTDVEPLQELIDMSFGTWEGRSLGDIRRNDADRYRLWREQPHLVSFPGGESLDAVRTRVMAALESLCKKHSAQTIILVSHRVVNKVMICAILGLDNSHFWQISQDPTAINLIQYRDGTYILSLMNECCHLRSLRHETGKVDF